MPPQPQTPAGRPPPPPPPPPPILICSTSRPLVGWTVICSAYCSVQQINGQFGAKASDKHLASLTVGVM